MIELLHSTHFWLGFFAGFASIWIFIALVTVAAVARYIHLENKAEREQENAEKENHKNVQKLR